MPLYEYECEACGNRFEKIQKFSDPLADTCPKCGAGPVRKLMSSPAIQFKGSGFYITDYPKKDGAGKDPKDTKDTKDTKGTKGTNDTKDTKAEGAKSADSSKDTKSSGESSTAKAADTKSS
jgi:putative FmdB family regulatory protein